MTKYSPRHVKLSEENIEKLNQIKELSGRTQQWVINEALTYFFKQNGLVTALNDPIRVRRNM